MGFDLHIGIDYSGADTPTSRLAALQVYASAEDNTAERVTSPSSQEQRFCNWTRQDIAHWLVEIARSGKRFIAGIDHAFSFPITYFQRYELNTWDEFLTDFCKHWPTYEPNVFIDLIRDRGAPDRTGANTEFRLTEKWTSSAKSVFQFDVQGQVAKSTHAGIPWLHYIRRHAGNLVYFWPFDGWDLSTDKCVVTEVYPSIFRHRYPRQNRTGDQQDAYSVARWLRETDQRGFLDRYLHPPLTEEERQTADVEGWILGVA